VNSPDHQPHFRRTAHLLGARWALSAAAMAGVIFVLPQITAGL
jgi:hypothetical protein